MVRALARTIRNAQGELLPCGPIRPPAVPIGGNAANTARLMQGTQDHSFLGRHHG